MYVSSLWTLPPESIPPLFVNGKLVGYLRIWCLKCFSINLLVVYRESVNLIGYITRRLSADSLQL